MYIAPPLGLVFALAGVTQILVRGAIFEPLQRRLPSLFHCALCAGFWVGALGVFYFRGAAERVSDFFLDGAGVALASVVADGALARLLGD